MKIESKNWLVAAVACVAIVAGGCGQSAKTTPSKTEWIDPSKLQPGPIQHTSLTDDQMGRVRRLQSTFSEVDGSPLDKWVEDFKRDADPEKELRIWEGMAAAYEAFTASNNLSLDGKKDAYRIVILRSGADVEEVLKHLKLKVLTEKQAREVMALFTNKPEPITAVRQ